MNNRIAILMLAVIFASAAGIAVWLGILDTSTSVPDHARQDATSEETGPVASVGGGFGTAPLSSSDESPLAAVRFSEVSGDVGLDVHYVNGVNPDLPGLMIYQSIGGGVAVIDADRDGLPDLFFPQASVGSPLDQRDSSATDVLIRNRSGRAADVSAIALPTDSDYGCGAAAGDVDGDGFPDLYVTNAGINRLLHNNGDGTFDRLPNEGISRDAQWTASAMIADLNGDGFPEIYDVNYCGGERPYTQVCMRESGQHPRTCIPTEFSAADDRLLLNSGDGSFQDVSQAAGILIPDGRGLGIIAAEFDGTAGLDLYVANDMTANFLFLNRTPQAGSSPLFEDHGVVSGTAYDFDGKAQASMGIAVDDADNDGLPDLFVTHFYNESNTYYHQQPGFYFVDESVAANLQSAAMQTLGFGTQFLDADLDGWPDLVVVNGHVDDFTETGVPYRMKPQFFRNRGGRFTERPAADVGAFFAAEQLGRGLAKLDWNRDGREDFVVSRLIDPAALVVNDTSVTGHSAILYLTGRIARDAIGAKVTITAGGVSRTRQLVAGDGFASTNERRIVCGLGTASHIDSLHVIWPDGSESSYSDLPADRAWRLVQGVGTAFELPAEAQP
ncbi:MAG: CRTAC1 family protein [Planctomycetaceae bacterium]